MHKTLFFPLVLLSLIGCSGDKPFTSNTTAFGHPLSLEIHGLPPEKAEAVTEEIFADLHYLSDAAHPWSEGALGRTNQLLALAAEFSANPSMLPLITAAQRLEKQTRGYYAPALGGLQKLWGFHSEIPDGPVPDAASIAELLATKPRMDDIQVKGIRLNNNNPAVRVDFGAMAQGFALDIARQRLIDTGVSRARLLNGNITTVIGNDWQVTLANGEILLLQNGEAIVTLERDEYAFTKNGENYHPYLNPFSGYPSPGLHLVSVIQDRGADAAALAQALLNGGKEKLAELLGVIPVEYALAITDEGKVLLSNGLKRRLGTVQR